MAKKSKSKRSQKKAKKKSRKAKKPLGIKPKESVIDFLREKSISFALMEKLFKKHGMYWPEENYLRPESQFWRKEQVRNSFETAVNKHIFGGTGLTPKRLEKLYIELCRVPKKEYYQKLERLSRRLKMRPETVEKNLRLSLGEVVHNFEILLGEVKLFDRMTVVIDKEREKKAHLIMLNTGNALGNISTLWYAGWASDFLLWYEEGKPFPDVVKKKKVKPVKKGKTRRSEKKPKKKR